MLSWKSLFNKSEMCIARTPWYQFRTACSRQIDGGYNMARVSICPCCSDACIRHPTVQYPCQFALSVITYGGNAPRYCPPKSALTRQSRRDPSGRCHSETKELGSLTMKIWCDFYSLQTAFEIHLRGRQHLGCKVGPGPYRSQEEERTTGRK